MNGIKLEGGINNCHWNIDGKCTNKEITRNIISRVYSRDWDSKMNCSLTIIGTHKCSGYKMQKGD